MGKVLHRFNPALEVETAFAPPPCLTLVDCRHPARAAAEAFVEARFQSAFGARVHSHYPHIATRLGPCGEVLAAAGVRFAGSDPLFLETYLDEPVEQALARTFGRPVARDGVVEIGAFAAVALHDAFALFSSLAAWLDDPCRKRFAVATARPELERLLRRAGFQLRALASADPARLGPAAADWGTYYGPGPKVFGGEVAGSAALPLLRERLRLRAVHRRLRGSGTNRR